MLYLSWTPHLLEDDPPTILRNSVILFSTSNSRELYKVQKNKENFLGSRQCQCKRLKVMLPFEKKGSRRNSELRQIVLARGRYFWNGRTKRRGGIKKNLFLDREGLKKRKRKLAFRGLFWKGIFLELVATRNWERKEKSCSRGPCTHFWKLSRKAYLTSEKDVILRKKI